MRIKKIEWKNFSSYGNKKQSLEFTNSGCLFQVIGSNGVGKTSISQVIAFCLYGKVEGKKLGDIPNRINGNTWTRIEFEADGKNVIVERGLEPSLFNLFVDDKKYDQAGNRNIQDYLTDDLIGIPYYVFNNTISLSVNDFKSFIKMSPQDKRAIVDKIFGFHILNQMREVLKGEMRKIKESMDILTGEIKASESSISRSIIEMESLLTNIEEETKSKIIVLNENLEKFKGIQKIHSEKVNNFKKIESDLYDLISKSNRNLIDSRSEYLELEKRLKLYTSDKCPTCESSLDSEFHQHLKESIQFNHQSKFDKMTKSEDELKELKVEEESVKSTKSDLYQKGLKIEMRIKEIIAETKKLESISSDKQVESLNNIIKNLKEDRDNLNSEFFKKDEKNLWVKKLDEVLGDKGVKQMAIKTILPSLNSEILELLSSMHLDFQVVFDEEFKGSIYHMGVEIPVQTLSTGEMKKVDFVVLIAIMKLMKLKFNGINLLFLDELFSSVDAEGVHSILQILSKNSKDMLLNIFVINHAPMPSEIFDWKLDVTKANNFSSISLGKF